MPGTWTLCEEASGGQKSDEDTELKALRVQEPYHSGTMASIGVDKMEGTIVSGRIATNFDSSSAEPLHIRLLQVKDEGLKNVGLADS